MKSFAAALATLALLVASPARALTDFPTWALGDWNCQIDGRPARMHWRQENAPAPDAGDGLGRTNHGTVIVGEFWDGDGPAARLTALSKGADYFRFRHQDGNIWQLNRRSDDVLRGFTTWNGARYPLNCTRVGYAPRPYGSDIAIQPSPIDPQSPADPDDLDPLPRESDIPIQESPIGSQTPVDPGDLNPRR